jgi:hypothetical protein
LATFWGRDGGAAEANGKQKMQIANCKMKNAACGSGMMEIRL